jgi:protein quaking
MHQLLEEKEKLKELFNEPFNILLPISAKLLDEEISRIRVNLFQLGGKESVCLPEPIGTPAQQTEKLYVPVKDHPEFNFVGRILGPRGMTAKQLEQETGCKIMVRGKGSMRDKAKEDQMKGKPNWEHLNDELHVLITVEDTQNRAEVKLKRAVEEIKRLLVPAPEGEDELKKKQLMELAIINGTYRDGSKLQQKMSQILLPTGLPPNTQLSVSQLAAAIANANHTQLVNATALLTQQHGQGDLRSPPGNNQQLGQPLIISPRPPPQHQHHHQSNQQYSHYQNQNNLNLLAQQQQVQLQNTVQFLNGHNHHHHHHQQHQQQQQHQELLYSIPSQYLDHSAFAAAAAAQAALLEGASYPTGGLEFSQSGPMLVQQKQQRFQQQQQQQQTVSQNGAGSAGSSTSSPGVSGGGNVTSVRAHPYARVALS